MNASSKSSSDTLSKMGSSPCNKEENGGAVVEHTRGLIVKMPAGFPASGNVPKWILHPQSNGRACWDMVGLLLVWYDMFAIPFMFFNPPEEGLLNVMVWVTRLFWLADMPASFVTGFVHNDGNIEMRPWRIVRKYLQTWFLLDAFIVGIDWAELFLQDIFVQIAGFG